MLVVVLPEPPLKVGDGDHLKVLLATASADVGRLCATEMLPNHREFARNVYRRRPAVPFSGSTKSPASIICLR